MAQEYEVVIIGGGPAGLSAGIFVARQKVSCLLISKDLGGQLNLIPKLENYPGTIMSSGPLLARTLENQFLMFGREMIYDTVERVEEIESGLSIKTTRSEYKTKSLVLSPGKVPNNLGVENESNFVNKGVHY
ncbi:MAG: NAD(P)/FAD-dependent oxidoreductase, partial [Nitrosotalea sp.]